MWLRWDRPGRAGHHYQTVAGLPFPIATDLQIELYLDMSTPCNFRYAQQLSLEPLASRCVWHCGLHELTSRTAGSGELAASTHDLIA